MTYTILSAQYANEDNTAAVIETEEAGSVLVSEVDTPDLWAELQAWGTPSPYARPSSVPQQVSRAQAKIALNRAGLLPAVKQTVADAGGEVAIWFEDALNWRRDNPNVNALGVGLGLSPEQIDDLFRRAALIEA